MRLAPVAMASVQASRFSSSPSTPAQAQPATQARTGQLVFARNPRLAGITKKDVLDFLGDGIKEVIRDIESKKNCDVQVVPSKGKVTAKKFGYRLVPRGTNPSYDPNQDQVVFLKPVQFEAQKATHWWEPLVSTIKEQNSKAREKRVQEQRRQKVADKRRRDV